ncbi:MAG TPA: peptidoglycan DD-metalloendopeptidase family protein [Steroidobacteraceae bacterium]|nr:peptidoglycan DD-metalloendopeptidase family protein [Steroidobacteraceae bacterium]
MRHRPPPAFRTLRAALRPLARLAVLAASAWPLLAAAAPNAGDAESQLRRVQARIRAVTDAVQADVAQRDSIAAQLHAADQALAAARMRVDSVREKRAASEARRAELRAEEARAAAALEAERTALAGQLQAAYLSGPQEQLKVLLNAEDPATLGRMLRYYAYLGQARADRIGTIRDEATRLEAVDQELAAENARLVALEEDRRREAAAFEIARGERQRALGALQARIQKGSGELKDLKANAAALEDLLARLRAALEDFDSEDLLGRNGQRRAFSQVHGRLPWPAHGKLLANFGEPRAGGLKWNGLLLGTRPGGEIRAPYFGRVVYADWLPGLGLLLILDHGGGFLSLYGYNERLYKGVGDKVRPGEIVAASLPEGSARPELYFEIRQGARPLDPRPWLRGAPRP